MVKIKKTPKRPHHQPPAPLSKKIEKALALIKKYELQKRKAEAWLFFIEADLEALREQQKQNKAKY